MDLVENDVDILYEEIKYFVDHLGQSQCIVSWHCYQDYKLGNRAIWVSWGWNSSLIWWNSFI